MHDTAYWLGRKFFSLYWPRPMPAILDVGAIDVNGSLRAALPGDALYVGLDIAAGRGVDVVARSGERFPYRDQSFDVVASTSCFEHDVAFWVTFLEMARVLKDGGYMYINAPSNGPIHRYPQDCWRFHPDAATALSDWGRSNGTEITVIEAFIAPLSKDGWRDCVMIFGRGSSMPIQWLSDAAQELHGGSA